MNNIFTISFRCYYPNGNKTNHTQTLQLEEIGRWIEAYQFTHPEVEAITAKVWTHG